MMPHTVGSQPIVSAG